MQDYKKRRTKPRRAAWKKRPRAGYRPDGKLLAGGLEPLPQPPRRRAQRPDAAAWIARGKRLVSPRTVFVSVCVWLGVGIVYGVASTWQAPLTHLEIAGLEHLSPARIAAAARLHPGVAMIDIDPFRTAERLLRLARVRGVNVRRALPGRLSIAVEERRGLALVLLVAGDAALIDGDGIVLETHLPAGEMARLPLPRIRSTARTAVAGQRLDDPALERGLALLAEAGALGLPARERLSLDATDPFMTTIALPGRERVVILPYQRSGEALAAYMALEGLLESVLPGARTVDMRAAFRDGTGWVALNR